MPPLFRKSSKKSQMDSKIKKPLLGMTLDELKGVAEEAGLRPFAAKQMARWIYTKRVTDIGEMTDLPKAAREWLMENYTVGVVSPKGAARSTDGTVKYLLPPQVPVSTSCQRAPAGVMSRRCISRIRTVLRCVCRRRRDARWGADSV